MYDTLHNWPQIYALLFTVHFIGEIHLENGS